MDTSSVYYARCVKKLESLGLPTSGWVCAEVIDLEEAEFTCELCGHEGIRYIHVMMHHACSRKLSVGCICAGIISSRQRSGNMKCANAASESTIT